MVVDDRPLDAALAAALTSVDWSISAIGPADIKASGLQASDLIVVDWNLEKWEDRIRRDALASWTHDGLALVGVLRAHLRRLHKARPTAFALQSSYLSELSDTMPSEYRAHALARVLNLEWVFEKPTKRGLQTYLKQLRLLAAATAALPADWPPDDASSTTAIVKRLLALPTRAWSDAAELDIERCRPPVHDLVAPTKGIAFIRWLLQRVLPYPCFLWDEPQLALRLGVIAGDLGFQLESKAARSLGLTQCKYRGILADFMGPRWWRSGIESTLWRLTSGDSSDRKQVHAVLAEAGIQFRPLDPEPHVVCVDARLQVMARLQPARLAVRVIPDDWPSFAEPAWTPIEVARDHPEMRALVVADDLERLGA